MPKTGTLKEKELQNSVVFNVVHESFYGRVIDFAPLDKKINAFIKRAFDFCLSGILILILCPVLMPIISLLIKLDSKGPILFIQKRNSRNGNVFNCLKFRTMYVNSNAHTQPCMENDSRITRIGRILRKYHLDELPQLFNVLIGQMSIIGPRPFMINENLIYEKIFHNYTYRQKVKPGITGLAQSYGFYGFLSSSDQLKQRLAYDHDYINQWSFKMDIEIIGRTLKNAFNVQKPENNKI